MARKIPATSQRNSHSLNSSSSPKSAAPAPSTVSSSGNCGGIVGMPGTPPFKRMSMKLMRSRWCSAATGAAR